MISNCSRIQDAIFRPARIEKLAFMRRVMAEFFEEFLYRGFALRHFAKAIARLRGGNSSCSGLQLRNQVGISHQRIERQPPWPRAAVSEPRQIQTAPLQFFNLLERASQIVT